MRKVRAVANGNLYNENQVPKRLIGTVFKYVDEDNRSAGAAVPSAPTRPPSEGVPDASSGAEPDVKKASPANRAAGADEVANDKPKRRRSKRARRKPRFE